MCIIPESIRQTRHYNIFMLTRRLNKCMGTLTQPKHDQLDEIHRDKMPITKGENEEKKKNNFIFKFQSKIITLLHHIKHRVYK